MFIILLTHYKILLWRYLIRKGILLFYYLLKDKAALLAKHMKQYDSLKLEAARLERDAQRINVENAVTEGEKLRKDVSILDIELETVCS